MPYTKDITSLCPLPTNIIWFESQKEWYRVRDYDGANGTQGARRAGGNMARSRLHPPPVMAGQVTLWGTNDCPLVIPSAWQEDLERSLRRPALIRTTGSAASTIESELQL